MPPAVPTRIDLHVGCPAADTYITCAGKRYDLAGKKQLLEDVNTWTALTEILRDILEDPKLQNALSGRRRARRVYNRLAPRCLALFEVFAAELEK